MKAIGKIILVDNIISGETAEGKEWMKQTVVVETTDANPKKIAIEFFGEEKVAVTKQLKKDQLIEVTYDVSSREYAGKWYTQCSGIKVTPYEAQKE